jgi:hypothetical protein
MGKKKSSGPQSHATQSFGQMVSKAALSQMMPQIEDVVRHYVNQLGSQIAQKSAETIEHLHARVVCLEALLMDKGVTTKEELSDKIASIEDDKRGVAAVDGPAESGDSVRVTIETKLKDQAEYQGRSLVRIDNVGTGNSFGPELESAIVGMKANEVKEVTFGKDKELGARLSVARVSRPKAPQGVENANQA